MISFFWVTLYLAVYVFYLNWVVLSVNLLIPLFFHKRSITKLAKTFRDIDRKTRLRLL